MSIDAFKSSDHEFNAERERQDGAALERYERRRMDFDYDESDAYPLEYCPVCKGDRLMEVNGWLVCECGQDIRNLEEDEDED